MTRAAQTLLIAFLNLGVCCAGIASQKPDNSASPAQRSPAHRATVRRDWKKFPAIVQIDTEQDLYVIGDAHADSDRLTAALLGSHLILGKPSDSGKVSWAGGQAILVFTGDYIDKGDSSLKVISLLRALQAAAASARGRVVLLMGNHEAEFLADPSEKKVQEFAAELRSKGISPDAVASCEGDIGEFFCSLPFAARVNDWFLSHAGNTGGRTLQALAEDLQTGVDRDGFASQQLIGRDSILEARLDDNPWFDNKEASEEKTLKKYASALGVSHIVQGHQHGKVQFSDGERREPGEMFQRYGLIFFEDTGMSRGVDDSVGGVLHIEAREPRDVVAICPDGSTTILWDQKTAQSLGRAKPCGH